MIARRARLCALLAMAAISAAPTEASERVSLRRAGVTVVFDRRDEDFALIFAERLPPLLKAEKLALAAPGDTSLAEFKKNREVYLAAAARYLGLKEPTRGMRQMFDSMTKSVTRQEDALASALIIDTVQIWREPELIARLREHGEDEYFQPGGKDASPMPKNGWNVSVNSRHSSIVKFSGTLRTRAFLPVILKEDDPADLAARVDLHVQQAADYLRTGITADVSTIHDLEVGMVLHEVVEWKIVSTFISSADRRWFCEGMANFIAYRALVDATTPERARRHYDLAQQLVKWGSQERQVDLANWKAAEKMTGTEQESDLNTAQYAYATKVIADIAEKHGVELIPRWFGEIAQTPRDKVTMKTVADAFVRLTGENLASYYPGPLFSLP